MKSCFLFFLFVSYHRAYCDFVVSPNLPDGNSGGGAPFIVTSDLVPSYRYQEVHGASDFANVASFPLLITELSFAPRREGQPTIDLNLANIDIRFSTTMRNPDSLSPVFAENTGIDEMVAFSGPLHFYDAGGERFGIHVQLQRPFLYDYHLGNLLIDVRNYAPATPPSSGGYILEGQLFAPDSVSSVGAVNVNASSGFFGYNGTIIRFTYTPVPEPRTWVLFSLGIFVIAFSRIKRAPKQN